MEKSFMIQNGEQIGPFVIELLFESVGVTDTDFRYYGNGAHAGYYAVGQHEGKEVGIKFGRPFPAYEYEAQGLERLSHASIPKCYGRGKIKSDKGNFGYMLVQHFNGNSLENSICPTMADGRIKTINLLIGLMDLLDYVHEKNILHNDIREDHVLIVDGRPCLIDFHLWEPTQTPSYDLCGRISYPDIVEKYMIESPRLIPHEEVDPWEPKSFGTLL